MSEEEEILKQTIIEEEKPKSALAEKLKEKKKVQRKKNIKIGAIFIVIAFISYIVWWGTRSYKATEEYGICRSLLELFIPYPHTIYVSEIKPLRDGSLKLWYTHIDAFGEYRMEEFICGLERDAKTGALKLSSIKVNKVYIDKLKIKHLNNALIYFQENPLVLNWPAALPDSIDNLHLDFNAVRKIILNIQK